MPQQNLSAGPVRLVRAETDGDDLWIGVAYGRDGLLVPDASVAGDDLRHHFALCHGAVGQHRLASDVADGIDPTHRSLTSLPDPDEGAVHVENKFLGPPALGYRLATNC